MDPHGVNPMAMQGMSMPMSMPMGMTMPMASNAPNAQQMAALGINPMAPQQYGMPVNPQQQQQQMMMGMNPAAGGMNPMNMAAMGMKMNPNAGMNPNAVMNPNAPGGAAAGAGAMPVAPAAADWRIQLTREHRANLIAKMYVPHRPLYRVGPVGNGRERARED